MFKKVSLGMLHGNKSYSIGAGLKRTRFVVGTLMLAGCLNGLALAADFRELAVPKLSRDEQTLASNFSRGKVGPSPEAEAALKKLVLSNIAKMTQAAEAADCAKHRMNLQSMLTERNQTPEARQTIISDLGRFATGVASSDSFSPVARINCTAILAEMDDATENVRERRPPLPSRGAFNSLRKIAADPAFPAHLRAIALHGIERHVRVYWTAEWNDAQRAEVQKIATDIIAADPKTSLDAAAHAWLTRRAYDILAAAGAPAAVNVAIEHLAEPTTLPSVRLGALSYLAAMDLTALPAAKQNDYMIGLSHFVRSQLVDWYEYQEDVIKRDSGAQAAGGGGYGGGYMMGGSGSEGYGGSEGGSSMEGYGGGMLGGSSGSSGYGGYGNTGAANRPKPIDTQDWRTRSSRRLLNQITQQVHIALDGKPLSEGEVQVAKPLAQLNGNAALVSQVEELVTLVDELQTAVNDAVAIKTINTLLTGAKLPIENIMEFSIELPGFTDRYPHLAEEEESLKVVPEAPQFEEPMEEEPAVDGDGEAPTEDPAAAAGEEPEGEAVDQ